MIKNIDTLVVAGSRSINDFDTVHRAIVDSPFWPLYHATIISGDAEGVDEQAEKFAEEVVKSDFNLDYEEYEANWDEHGKAAGPLRNKRMAVEGDALVAVWDGESNGTRDMIEKALEWNLDVYVTVVDDE